MIAKPANLGWVHRLLIVLVVINIIGDIGNVVFWYASPDSQGSLLGGYIASATGGANALIAGSVILLVVAVVYIVSLFGLLKKMQWAPLLIIAISVANRVLAVFLYLISPAFAFWGVWTAILIAVASLDWLKMKNTKKEELKAP